MSRSSRGGEIPVDFEIRSRLGESRGRVLPFAPFRSTCMSIYRMLRASPTSMRFDATSLARFLPTN